MPGPVYPRNGRPSYIVLLVLRVKDRSDVLNVSYNETIGQTFDYLNELIGSK